MQEGAVALKNGQRRAGLLYDTGAVYCWTDLRAVKAGRASEDASHISCWSSQVKAVSLPETDVKVGVKISN